MCSLIPDPLTGEVCPPPDRSDLFSQLTDQVILTVGVAAVRAGAIGIAAGEAIHIGGAVVGAAGWASGELVGGVLQLAGGGVLGSAVGMAISGPVGVAGLTVGAVGAFVTTGVFKAVEVIAGEEGAEEAVDLGLPAGVLVGGAAGLATICWTVGRLGQKLLCKAREAVE